MTDMKPCDRVAIYTTNVQGLEYTAHMPLREGATPPASIFRQGNFLTLHMIVRSTEVPVSELVAHRSTQDVPLSEATLR